MADAQRLLQLYELSARVRVFEERVAADFRSGKIPGIVHLSIGQEAVAAGVSVHLRESDYVVTTHRGHGHLLAKGAPANELMAEIWGKSTGLCRGKGGSQHIADASVGGFATGIVGQGQPLAAGLALALRERGSDGIVVSYFGDGAVTSGGLHEGAVIASVLALPVLFVAENNGYSETTHTTFHLAGRPIAERLSGYGFASEEVDGMDAEAVDAAAGRLIAGLRAGGGPALLECMTYRYHGHFEGDPMTYRTDDELRSWRERDPISRLRSRLLEAGVGEERVAELDTAVAREMDDAAAFADASPLPAPAEALEGVYV
jgi:TPP-dependent pyruvate/acetoin dehydrogenase alpha subunit